MLKFNAKNVGFDDCLYIDCTSGLILDIKNVLIIFCSKVSQVNNPAFNLCVRDLITNKLKKSEGSSRLRH